MLQDASVRAPRPAPRALPPTTRPPRPPRALSGARGADAWRAIRRLAIPRHLRRAAGQGPESPTRPPMYSRKMNTHPSGAPRPPPSRTNWTRLVPLSVLTGHVPSTARLPRQTYLSSRALARRPSARACAARLARAVGWRSAPVAAQPPSGPIDVDPHRAPARGARRLPREKKPKHPPRALPRGALHASAAAPRAVSRAAARAARRSDLLAPRGVSSPREGRHFHIDFTSILNCAARAETARRPPAPPVRQQSARGGRAPREGATKPAPEVDPTPQWLTCMRGLARMVRGGQARGGGRACRSPAAAAWTHRWESTSMLLPSSASPPRRPHAAALCLAPCEPPPHVPRALLMQWLKRLGRTTANKSPAALVCSSPASRTARPRGSPPAPAAHPARNAARLTCAAPTAQTPPRPAARPGGRREPSSAPGNAPRPQTRAPPPRPLRTSPAPYHACARVTRGARGWEARAGARRRGGSGAGGGGPHLLAASSPRARARAGGTPRARSWRSTR